jgi:hypothetical protein
MAGLDPIAFLKEQDETRRSLLHAVGRAATALRERENSNLVVQLTNNIAKMLGG